MRTLNLPLLLLLTLLSFSSCKKENVAPALPAATMEGKNTFGAVVNGKVWVPKGRPSTFRSNYNVVFEPDYAGGSLDIRAYRKIKDEPAVYEVMALGMSPVDHEGVYYWGNPELGSAYFYSENCEYISDSDVFREGKLEITKLDMKNGIIAGKFEFTVAKPGCDTIRVTEGRFDKKLF